MVEKLKYFNFNLVASFDASEFGIRYLYPIIGLSSAAIAFGYLYFGFSNPRVIRGKEKSTTADDNQDVTKEEKELVRKNSPGGETILPLGAV